MGWDQYKPISVHDGQTTITVYAFKLMEKIFFSRNNICLNNELSLVLTQV